MSVDTVALTLTYRDGDESDTRSTVLDYSDIQKLLKRLRKAGYGVRYLVAGEYGSARGRAHWHIVLFFDGKGPDLPPEETQKQEWAFWPHGFTFVQRPDAGGFRYVCKYMLKDDQRVSTAIVRMSKGRATWDGVVHVDDPGPIGWRWFRRLADDLARQGLPLNDYSYTHAEARYQNGQPVQFWLQGRMRELFLREYQIAWTRYRRGKPPQDTKVFIDIANREALKRLQDYNLRVKRYQKIARDRLNGVRPEKLHTSEDGQRLLWVDEDGLYWVEGKECGQIWRARLVNRHEIIAAFRAGRDLSWIRQTPPEMRMPRKRQDRIAQPPPDVPF